jgi:hypothetical protein
MAPFLAFQLEIRDLRVFLNLWAGQWLGRNKVFYGPLF